MYTKISTIQIIRIKSFIFLFFLFKIFQESKNQRYRFGLIIDELKQAETTSYKTTLVAFINCILIATDSVEDRIRIRNEFVGMWVYHFVSLGFLLCYCDMCVVLKPYLLIWSPSWGRKGTQNAGCRQHVDNPGGGGGGHSHTSWLPTRVHQPLKWTLNGVSHHVTFTP